MVKIYRQTTPSSRVSDQQKLPVGKLVFIQTFCLHTRRHVIPQRSESRSRASSFRAVGTSSSPQLTREKRRLDRASPGGERTVNRICWQSRINSRAVCLVDRPNERTNERTTDCRRRRRHFFLRDDAVRVPHSSVKSKIKPRRHPISRWSRPTFSSARAITMRTYNGVCSGALIK